MGACPRFAGETLVLDSYQPGLHKPRRGEATESFFLQVTASIAGQCWTWSDTILDN